MPANSRAGNNNASLLRARINTPLLILADEPTGNLDFKSGQDIMTLLQELHRDGRTILLVTHDDAVAAYALRELRLQDGTISDETVSSGSLRPVIGGAP